MSKSSYQMLCALADVNVHRCPIELTSYGDYQQLANKTRSERIAAGLNVLLDCLGQQAGDAINKQKNFLDELIVQLDKQLSHWCDSVLHHPDFQELEGLWQSVAYLASQTDFNANCHIDLLDISKQAVQQTFADAHHISQNVLYDRIYLQEYDTPGGEPYAAMVVPWLFDNSQQDISLLKQLSELAALCHCPLLAGISPQFFNKKDFSEVLAISDITHYLSSAEYIAWKQLRSMEQSRFLGLTLPRFLLRVPHDGARLCQSFRYYEQCHERADGLWGCASFVLAANLMHSFKQYGWALNIRGPENGGMARGLMSPCFQTADGFWPQLPTEAVIAESKELSFASEGFIPLSVYKYSHQACFFSANSVQLPELYQNETQTATARINARLPYILLSCRLAHYLKVLQRENIGSNKSAASLAEQLNSWLQTLVTKMPNPSDELVAQHPLREGYVEVSTIESEPGTFQVKLFALPHFQIEGMDIQLTVMSRLPKSSQSRQ